MTVEISAVGGSRHRVADLAARLGAARPQGRRDRRGRSAPRGSWRAHDPGDSLDIERVIAGDTELERLVARSRLIGSDPRSSSTAAATPRRSSSSPTTSAASGACCGSRAAAPTSRTARRSRLPGAVARRPAAAARARGDERRGDGRLPRALPGRARTRRGRRSRRSCTRSCRRRTSTTSTPTRSARSRTRPTRRRRCTRRSATTSRSCRTCGRGSSCRSASPTLADARAVVLAHHGLVTWGETHEESYELTLELVGRAREFLGEPRRAAEQPEPDGRAVESVPRAAARAALARAAVGARGRPQASARSPTAPTSSGSPAMRSTPDHMLRIGARTLRRRASTGSSTRHLESRRVVLVPGFGGVAAGPDKPRRARMRLEIAAHTHALGGRDARPLRRRELARRARRSTTSRLAARAATS